MTDDKILPILLDVSVRTKCPLETLLSLYLVLGEDILFLLHLLQGMTITFPSLSTVNSSFSARRRMFVKDGEVVTLENGKDVYSESLCKGVTILVDNNKYLIREISQSGFGFSLLHLKKVT